MNHNATPCKRGRMLGSASAAWHHQGRTMHAARFTSPTAPAGITHLLGRQPG